MILELERAQRVRDVLDRIGRRVSKVVHRVDAPRVAGPVMMRAPNPIEDRVAHVDVARRHVDLRAQHELAIGELAGPHPLEEIEVVGHRAGAIRTFLPRLGERAAILANLLGRQTIDVRQAVLDQVHGILVEPLEVVGRKVRTVVPPEAQPLNVFLDGVDVLDIFFCRVRIVEAQVARAAEFLGDTKVQANGLGVADVQIAVGLGRKTRRDLPTVLPCLDVFADDRPDEILGGRGRVPDGLCDRLVHEGQALIIFRRPFSWLAV
jgi:hypothetical protein